MLAYFWPFALVVGANVLYNVASRSVPKECDAFAVLVVTYLTASFLSCIGFFTIGGHRDISAAIRHIDWTAYALGIAMVGLEIGFIFMYRAGWKMSVACLATNAVLAAILILVGAIFFQEHISLREIFGMLVTAAGLVILLGDRA